MVLARPRAVALTVLLIAALAGAAAGLKLRVRPGYVDLLDRRSPLQARYLDLLDDFGNVEALFAVVSGPDPKSTARAADVFAAAMGAAVDKTGQPVATTVLGRVDPSWFVTRAPAFLPASVLDGLTSRAQATGLRQLVADPSPAALLTAAENAVRSGAEDAAAAGENAAAPPGPSAAATSASTAPLVSLLDTIGAAARGEDASIGSWLTRLSGDRGRDLDPTGHVRMGGDRLLVAVTPADTDNDYRAMAPFMEAARDAARQAAAAAPGSEVAFTGAPALVVDEMRAVQRDITLASVLSVVLVTLLFFVSFDSFRHVAFAGIANVAGLALTFGAALVLVGYLNLFSAVFAAVLAGLGIDFGIHVINHYEGYRRAGMDAREALLEVFRAVVPAIAISALTTAAAFLAITTSGFKGFAQLGLISGVGVVLCVAMSFTLVPALLAWSARGAKDSVPNVGREPWSLKLLSWPVLHPAPVAAAGAVILAVATYGALKLHFDHDLMNLQPSGTEAVALQKDPRQRVTTHVAFSLAATVEEAAAKAARFRALPAVASVHSAADLVPPADPERGAALARLSAAVGPAASPPATLVDVAATSAAAASLAARVQGLQDTAFDAGDQAAVAALQPVIDACARLTGALDLPGAPAGLKHFRDASAGELRAMAAALPELAARPLGPADLPPELGRRLVGKSGKLAVLVEPRESVWDRPALVEFVRQLRTVDPEVTGPPVQILELTETMRVSLEHAALLAFAVIVVLVAVSMRSVSGTAIALFPLVAGFVIMLGSMALLHVPLNPANLVALPLLLGIGVDGGVHVAHRWHELRDARATIADVGHPLLITSLTTVAGFLPLMFARHRGIKSLGAATCLGSLGMLVAVVVLMPVLLALLDSNKARKVRTAGDSA